MINESNRIDDVELARLMAEAEHDIRSQALEKAEQASNEARKVYLARGDKSEAPESTKEKELRELETWLDGLWGDVVTQLKRVSSPQEGKELIDAYFQKP